MLRAFDTWFLDTCEHFSHRWQKTFGQDCFWLAKVTLLISLTGQITFTGIKVWYGFIFSLGSIFGLIFAYPMWFLLIKTREKITLRLQKNGTANPEKLNRIRLPMLIFIFFMIGFLTFTTRIAYPQIAMKWLAVNIIAWLLFSLADYLSSCNPLPPGRAKIKEWYEAFKHSLVPATPELAPIKIPSSWWDFFISCLRLDFKQGTGSSSPQQIPPCTYLTAII